MHTQREYILVPIPHHPSIERLISSVRIPRIFVLNSTSEIITFYYLSLSSTLQILSVFLAHHLFIQSLFIEHILLGLSVC